MGGGSLEQLVVVNVGRGMRTGEIIVSVVFFFVIRV